MGKWKIHEIAKELGLGSKEIIKKAQELGIEVTSHLSSVEEEIAQKIKESFGKNIGKQGNAKEKDLAKANKEASKKANKKDAKIGRAHV